MSRVAYIFSRSGIAVWTTGSTGMACAYRYVDPAGNQVAILTVMDLFAPVPLLSNESEPDVDLPEAGRFPGMVTGTPPAGFLTSRSAGG